MIKLINKTKMIIRDKNGESLVESVVSLLIASILMLTVTMMISTSLRITAKSTAEAAEKQNSANKAVLGDYSSPTEYKLVLEDPTGEVMVNITVNFSDDGDFVAFSPKVT